MTQPNLLKRSLIAGLILGTSLITALTACTPAAQTAGVGTLAAPTTPAPPTDKTKAPAGPAPTSIQPTLTPTALPHLQIQSEELRGVQITFWHPWTGPAAAAIDEITANFNQSNLWGIQASAIDQGGADMLAEHIQTAFAKDELPNVVAAGAGQIQAWQKQEGTLINLNDYANSARWGLTAQEIADFPPKFWATGATSSSHFGMPAARTAQVLFYNQSWAQELGFPNPPATPDEFEAQTCAAAKVNASDGSSENDGTGGWIVSYDNLVMLSWMESFDFTPSPNAQTGQFSFNHTQVKDAYTFLRSLFDNNCAWTSRLPTPYEYFATRHALFYSGSIEDIPVQQRAQERLSSSDTWTVIPYPTEGRKPVIVTNDIQYAIPVNGPEQQLAAWLFVRYLTLPENQAQIARATGAWPASVAAIEQMDDYRQQYPQWAQTLLWMPVASPAPTDPDWLTVRNILEDASWNMFQANIKPESILQILSVLDATIQEVLGKTGS